MIDFPAGLGVQCSTLFSLFVSHWWHLTTASLSLSQIKHIDTIYCHYGKLTLGDENELRYKRLAFCSHYLRGPHQTFHFQWRRGVYIYTDCFQKKGHFKVTELLQCPFDFPSQYYCVVKHAVLLYHLMKFN